ncbi:Cytosine/adenosine deaminase [Oscillibacter sp. PC13]|uniref:amidohydrolase family protein n=1 Tax=Oscillibacter sp. PC13 TaxID=1855299 RepID=UPI0008F2BAAB|nr:amidohydrolase family protein [Oscillibacter sp. PC13]SFQ03497.1 Cytosine/adenosine deaminase [Oscillibacter sp. PC13]
MGNPVVWKDCKFLFATADPADISSGLSVLVDHEKILKVAPYEALVKQYGETAASWDVVDCSHKLVMPGLVDGHNHLCNTHMNLSRIFGINYDNIAEHMFTTIHDPYGWMTEECLYDISFLSALNAIKHGATTIENSTILPDTAFRAMQDAGCRGILAPQMATSFRLENDDLNWKQMLDRTERCIRDYHDPTHGMSVAVHIHDQWDTLEEVMLRGMAMAQKYDTKYVTHFWEFSDARDRADRQFASEGGAFLHYLNKGLINERCVFFHGSVLRESEIDRLAATGASVIHNPEINGTNCGNCAYIPYMLDAGVNVGVGSDYGSLDVMTSMKLSLLVHNIMPRAKKGLAPHQSFHLATLGGAKAYGLEDMIGSVEPGKRADLISIDLAQATHLAPMAASAIAYGPEILFFLFIRGCAGTETCDTMVDGRFLRRDGRFLLTDEPAAMEKANYWFEKFLPDLAKRRADGGHFARQIHPDYLCESDVDLEALLSK